ncbi:MAG: heme A synthase [Rhizobiales bacterium]|nr:heme A synthase [Hyphomicrobiales bacterium]
MSATDADVAASSDDREGRQERRAWPGFVRLWLYLVAALVLAVAVVGGATRLTDSGLSITEWKPILGAIPPLDEADWHDAFEKYRQIPQYQQINKGMSLEEFKFIYWWEWGHRQLARFVGLAFGLPLLVLLVLRRIPAGLAGRLCLILALGGLQGVMGWYMVQSGLSDRVDVSQYRLAAHLGLATVIFAALVWTALGLRPRSDPLGGVGAWQGGVPLWLRVSSVALVVGIILQILLGALVAGMNAGLSHNTWPLMDGAFIPDGLLAMQPAWLNVFENALTVQFNHRMAAYVLLAFGLAHVVAVRRNIGDSQRVRFAAGALAVGLVVQAGFGVWTLLEAVPLWLGLVHQAGAFVVLALALWNLHAVLREPGGGIVAGAGAAAEERD